MGAISIITSRFLSLYIGEEGKLFNLLVSLLSDSRTHKVSSASAKPPESLRSYSLPTVQFTRRHPAIRMVRFSCIRTGGHHP
jgi:hypothetical protein